MTPLCIIGLRHYLSIYYCIYAWQNELCFVQRPYDKNVVINGVSIKEKTPIGTKKNMSDVAECRYIRCRYIRSGMHGRDRKSAMTKKNMSDVAKIVIPGVVITGAHCV